MLNVVCLTGRMKGSPKRLNPAVVVFTLELEEESPLLVRCVAQRDGAATVEGAKSGDIVGLFGRLRAFTYNTGPATKASELQVVCSKVVNLSLEVEKNG